MGGMALTDRNKAKIHLGLPLADPTWDAFLTQVIPEVDTAIRNEIDRQVIEQKPGIVEYLDGNGREQLLLTHTPVQSVAEVREDQAGYWGQNPAGFDSTTILTPGVDYALRPDDPLTGWSRAGILVRINAAWPLRIQQPYDSLARKRIAGLGAVRVTYTAGYTTSPTLAPADLTLAANQVIAQVKASRAAGYLVNSEGLAEYHYSLGTLIQGFLQTGSVASILAKYRQIPV